MAKKQLEVIQLVISNDIDDDDEHKGTLDLISFVKNPAIESLFMFFNSDKKQSFTSQNEEKRIVTGAVMIPEKRILRQDYDKEDNPIGDPFLVYFNESTVRECQEIFWKESNHTKSNIDHQFGLDGCTVIESWIVENSNNDKSNELGFKDIPKGTWMCTFKIDNDTFWQDIKSGLVCGFSIEGCFTEMVKMSTQKIRNNTDETYDKVVELFKQYIS